MCCTVSVSPWHCQLLGLFGIGQEFLEPAKSPSSHYQLPGECELAEDFRGRELRSLPLDLLSGYVSFALESREHRMLALPLDFISGDFPFPVESREDELLAWLLQLQSVKIWLYLDDAPSALPLAFASSEEADFLALYRTCCPSTSSSLSSSDTCPSRVFNYFTLSGTCFAARRRDRSRSSYPRVSNLREENWSLPTDLNGAGATGQTPLPRAKMRCNSRKQKQPRRGNGPCAGTLRMEPRSSSKEKNRIADRNPDFVGRCVLRTRFELVFVSLRVA